MKRVLLLGIVLAASCKPDFGERESLITRTQVLAVRAEPAEVKPEEGATYEVLVATPNGPVMVATSWAYCATPKLLTENGAVSPACLASGVRPLADGPSTISATMPSDACFLFGPEVSSADLRPRDADITGGYYQPLRVTVLGSEGNAVAWGMHRVRCKLSRAGANIAGDFEKRYTSNRNPTLLPLTALVDGAPIALDSIPRGARVTLHASWTPQSAERYVSFDAITQAIIDRREPMRVSWFASAGTFESDRTGRTGEETETFSDNAWTAPAEATTTHLFVVLRDDRGGVAWSTHTLTTR